MQVEFLKGEVNVERTCPAALARVGTRDRASDRFIRTSNGTFWDTIQLRRAAFPTGCDAIGNRLLGGKRPISASRMLLR